MKDLSDEEKTMLSLTFMIYKDQKTKNQSNSILYY